MVSNENIGCTDEANELNSLPSTVINTEHIPQVLHNSNLSPPSSLNSTIENDPDNSQAISKISTLKDKSLMVSKNNRRGLFSNLSIIPEYKDAREYPPLFKTLIVFLIAYASMMGPMGTSIIFPAINPIASDLNTTKMNVNVSVGVYILSLGVFPIWWSSISELKGRRTVYVISFILLFGFCIGCALSPNIESFIVFRMLCGASSASVQSVGAGTIADLYIAEERGRNLGYYYLGALAGPLLAPIIGSLLVNTWSWRSTQWIMVILAGINVFLIILFLPETLRNQDNKTAIALILAKRRLGTEAKQELNENTDISNIQGNPIVTDEEIERIITQNRNLSSYELEGDGNFLDTFAPQLSKIQSKDINFEKSMHVSIYKKFKAKVEEEINKLDKHESDKSNWWNTLYIYLIKPLKSLHFLRYPPVLLAIIFCGVAFAIVYFVNISIEYTYSRPPYNFKPLYIGLLYIPNSITYIFTSIYGGRWVDHLLKRYKQKHGILAPEARLGWNIVIAVISFPISLLIFGWSLDGRVYWIIPLIGTALLGFATMIIIGATVSYLVDSLPGRGASAVALNNLVRQVLAAVAVFLTEPMLEGISIGKAFTILASIIFGTSGVLIILKKRGDYWRENYDLQRLYDLVD